MIQSLQFVSKFYQNIHLFATVLAIMWSLLGNLILFLDHLSQRLKVIYSVWLRKYSYS